MAPRRRRSPAEVTSPQQGHQSVEASTTTDKAKVTRGRDGAGGP
jgi:hypothetical protein